MISPRKKMARRIRILLPFVIGVGIAAIYEFSFNVRSEAEGSGIGSPDGVHPVAVTTSLGESLRGMAENPAVISTGDLIERFPDLAYLTISGDDIDSLTELVIADAPPKSIDIQFDEEQCRKWLAHMKTLPEWKDKAVRFNFLKTVAYSDPQLAISLSKTLGADWWEDDGSWWRRLCFSTWSEKDPQAALLAALESTDLGQHRERFLNGMAEQWARTDPLAFAAAVREGTISAYQINSNLRSHEAAEVIRAMSSLDLVDQIATIKTVSRFPQQFIAAALAASFVEDPASVLRNEFWTGAELDPNRYLGVMLRDRYRRMSFEDAVQEFAGVREEFGEEFSTGALAAITGGLSDVESFKKWRDALPDEIGEKHLRGFINTNAGQIPDDELIALAGDDPSTVDFALTATILDLSESDAFAAARLIDDERLGESRTYVAMDVARRLVANAPEMAFDLLQENIADEEELVGAQESVVREWITEDAWGASQFAADLPPGRLRDYSAVTIANELYDSEPLSSLHWALQISDDDARFQTLTRAPRAAMADQEFLTMVQESDLAEEERQRVLEFYRQRLEVVEGNRAR